MAEPFLAEIRLFSFVFAPKGWAQCSGQLLPINQNQALFSLLGTTYGGNGQTNFALPDLRGRCAMHFGGGHIQGEKAGSESVTLTAQQLPMHTHQLQAVTDNADTQTVTGSLFAGLNNAYRAPSSFVALQPTSISNTGGSQPHQNMSPFLAINFCIALQGIFPSRN